MMEKAIKSLVIGIAGGSASGKSTVVRRIVESFPRGSVALLDMDSYYLPLKELTLEERRRFNYDSPAAFDIPLLQRHLDSLLQGRRIPKPMYSFEEYDRAKGVITVSPASLVLVEGLLALAITELRSAMDIRLFVDTPADLRLLRRIARDVAERGRGLELVLEQYYENVRPMHERYCEPSKIFADLIIPDGGFNDVAVRMTIDAIKARLSATT